MKPSRPIMGLLALCLGFAVLSSANAQAPQEPVLSPAETAELYGQASAMITEMPEDALNGLAVCPSCVAAPHEIAAALELADPILEVLERANAQPAVDWGVPEQLTAQDVVSLRPTNLAALNMLALLRAQSRIDAGEIALALDDLELSATLCLRTIEQAVLVDAMRGNAMRGKWVRTVAANIDRFDGPARERLLEIIDRFVATQDAVPDALAFERERLIGWTLTADREDLERADLTPLFVRMHYGTIYDAQWELEPPLRLGGHAMARELPAVLEEYSGYPMSTQVMASFIRARQTEHVLNARVAALHAELLLRQGDAAAAARVVEASPLEIVRTEEPAEGVWQITPAEGTADRWDESTLMMQMPR